MNDQPAQQPSIYLESKLSQWTQKAFRSHARRQGTASFVGLGQVYCRLLPLLVWIFPPSSSLFPPPSFSSVRLGPPAPRAPCSRCPQMYASPAGKLPGALEVFDPILDCE